MELLNIPVIKSEGMMELWSYHPSGNKLSSWLTIHEDDYGGVNYKVETCIFYLRKDEIIEGGNLIYLENTSPIKKFMCFTINETDEKKLEVKENMIVIMNGDLQHKPEDMSGWGLRNCIVVQFRSNFR